MLHGKIVPLKGLGHEANLHNVKISTFCIRAGGFEIF